MGNGESTGRIVAMQRGDDGVIQISEDVMKHLRGEKLTSVHLGEGEKIIHEDELDMLLHRTLQEGKRIQSEKFNEETILLKQESEDLLAQRAEEEKKRIAETEERWRVLLQETNEKEKNALRLQLEEEGKQKIKELEEHWRIVLEETKKEGKAALMAQLSSEEVEHSVLRQAMEKEKEDLHVQLLEEHARKVEDMEKEWSSQFEDGKAALMAQLSSEDAENSVLRQATEKEKEDLRVQLLEEHARKVEDMEKEWKERSQEALEKEKNLLSSQFEDQQMTELEAYNIKMEGLEKEKETLCLQLKEEGKQQVEEVETQWQNALKEATDSLQKEKDTAILQMEELEKQRLQEEEAKWQVSLGDGVHLRETPANVYRKIMLEEATAVHLEEEKHKIEEIDAKWMAKIEESEKEHAEKLSSLEELHIAEMQTSANKVTEQEELVNNMLKTLGELGSRADDIREQFMTSAEEIESQVKPLRRKLVCLDPRNTALSCYKENPNHPLRCSQEVQNFVNCVQAERLSILQRNVAS